MGACDFKTIATGKDARAAFSNAISRAQHDSGHGGYTGTIAEKHDFVVIRDTPADLIKRVQADSDEHDAWIIQDLEKAIASKDPNKIGVAVASALMSLDDERIDDKWGPAGCIPLGHESYLFFGYASS